MNNVNDIKKSKLYTIGSLSGLDTKMVNGHVGKFAYMSNGRDGFVITEDAVSDEFLLMSIKTLCKVNNIDFSKYSTQYSQVENKEIILDILEEEVMDKLINLPTEGKFSGSVMCTDKGLAFFDNYYNTYGEKRAEGFNDLLTEENPDLVENVKKLLKKAREKNMLKNQENQTMSDENSSALA